MSVFSCQLFSLASWIRLFFMILEALTGFLSQDFLLFGDRVKECSLDFFASCEFFVQRGMVFIAPPGHFGDERFVS